MTTLGEAVGLIRRAAGELRDPPIVQLGPPRTGSTLVWNALRVLCPQRVVLKRHGLTPLRAAVLAITRAELVCTIRHPLDALASSLLAYDEAPTPDRVAEHWARLEPAYRQVLARRGRPRVLVLRYEEVAHDIDRLVDEIAAFARLRVDAVTREAVRARCDLDAAAGLARALGDFARVDPDTQIHGRHVSEHRGGSGYYPSVLSPRDLDRLRPCCAPLLAELGYAW